MKKIVLLGVAIVFVASPALADYYVVREGTGPCRVVETRPTDTKIVVVGNKVYKTKTEAEKEITTVCK